MTNKATGNVSAFELSVAENGVGWLTVDVPNEAQNTVKAEFAEQFEAIFEQVKTESSINSIVIITSKTFFIINYSRIIN